MKQVRLTNSRRPALVDDADYPRVCKFTWHVATKGYVYRRRSLAEQRRGGPKSEALHRRILRLHWSDKRQGDHIHGDKLDNRRSQLRVCTNRQNHQNRTRVRKDSASGVTGVDWIPARRKWRATIYADGKSHHLGEFRERDKAVRCRRRAEKRFFGEFAPKRKR